MVTEGYRDWARPYIQRLARPFRNWSPDRLSYLALALAALAGGLAGLARWLGAMAFLPVSVLIFFAGLFDVLDGEVARSTGRAGPRGDFLDHVLDRYADLFIVVGLAVSSFSQPLIALAALVSQLLTSYMGTQAQAVHGERDYGGLLTRADRLVILAVVTFLEFDLSLPWPWAPSAPWASFLILGVRITVIDAALIYFIVAGQLTAVVRARRAYRSLPPAGPPPLAR